MLDSLFVALGELCNKQDCSVVSLAIRRCLHGVVFSHFVVEMIIQRVICDLVFLDIMYHCVGMCF